MEKLETYIQFDAARSFKNLNSKIEKTGSFHSYNLLWFISLVLHKFALIQLEFYLIDVYKC
ncbi:hypothetical protein D9M71_03550 [compost metagenome]